MRKADVFKGLRVNFWTRRGKGGKQRAQSTCGCCVMEQNYYAIAAFRYLFKKERDIKRVIEVGTGEGGFSQFLNGECLRREIEFRTFELYPEKCTACEKHDFTSELIPNDEKVGEIISQEGRTVLLVDSADKAGDISKFAPHLKNKDIVMGHDYAKDRTIGRYKLRDTNIWRSRGWYLSDIRDNGVMKDNDLEEFRPRVFWRAAWGAFIKNDKKH
jgi:hypothetical protein